MIDWVLISPAETGIGGKVDFDVSVRADRLLPTTLLWAAEGGSIERSDTEHAEYTCAVPGYFRVTLTAKNTSCETSQETHIQCGL